MNSLPAKSFYYKINFWRLIASLLILLPLSSEAEFTLNFQPNPNVVSSVANVTCPDGGGGMMMGGNIGPGCGSDTFLQEVVSDNGTQYYHVILGDQNQDFALEFYLRTAGCCWFTDGGMMMGGGGDAPYSASYGNTNDQLASAFEPLAGPDTSGTGTGNPSRVYMLLINNDTEMNQRFEKRLEANKPRITQNIDDGSTQINFDLDMSNGGYGGFTSPRSFTNSLALNQPDGTGDFNMATDAPQADITAGQFRYSAGSGFGGSYGTYTYADQGFDVYNTDWLSFCDPSQNPDRQCQFSAAGGGGGGGMMGM
jgi:hypothetical protein